MTARKYGTFGGVFTPSILTILGVIMYLRLPAIVGQAGLWQALGIIALAHVISFATGLSVASVATDKKVHGGGTYYMLSRSLGLPIGGTLGIALFVGLSFSVSLYLIGFSESFLGTWGLPVTKNAIRLTGASALVLVAAVTVISTALAMRAQYVIMGAIGLSLLSILLGRHEFAPAAPAFQPLPDAAPFITLFGIFFPAVTGFEAGVSMSGDLRDPKKSIPLGTIAAIGTGFLVYVGLTVFFAFNVDAAQLAGNRDLLPQIALFAPLVIAGIWGATLSSALGSILGAPRILQAVAADRIAPAFFARGVGRQNEPRNALLLASAIALSGVLIAELDSIARIVSMFFIATYGFLNLSCAIESWASPDFRPEFRTPRAVSLTGAIACFIVMIQLDLLAMLGATVVLGILYLYLARRQLSLESGDAWEGFWSSVARSALHRLDRSRVHERNWRPNILLFGDGSGPSTLAELGTQLVAQRGVVSRFELAVRPDEDGVRAPEMLRDGGAQTYGVFQRRVVCDNAYAGMESVARFYGFAGMEPNTVLTDWERVAREPERLVALLDTLTERDHNVLLVRSDPARGLGLHRYLDIWWRGGSNVGLAVALARILSTSNAWHDAHIRFLTVNDGDRARSAVLARSMALQLADARLDAEVRVIDNAVERRSFSEIAQAESAGADLVLMGLDDVRGEPGAWVRQTNTLLEYMGNVLLIRASSFFQAPPLPPTETRAPAAPRADEVAALPILVLPRDEGLAAALTRVDDELQSAAREYAGSWLDVAHGATREFVEDIAEAAERALEKLEQRAGLDRPRLLRALSAELGDLLYRLRRIATDARDRSRAAQREALAGGSDALAVRIHSIVDASPERVAVDLAADDLDASPGVGLLRRAGNALRRLRARGGRVRFDVPFRTHVRRGFANGIGRAELDALERFARDAYRAVADAQQLVGTTWDAFARIEAAHAEDRADDMSVTAERARLQDQMSGFLEARTTAAIDTRIALYSGMRRVASDIAEDLDQRAPVRSRADRVEAERLRALALDAPDTWAANQALLLDAAALETRLLALQHRLRVIVRRARTDLRLLLLNEHAARLRELDQALERYLLQSGPAHFTRTFEDWPAFEPERVVQDLVAETREATADMPERLLTPEAASIDGVHEHPLEPAAAVEIALRPLVEYQLDTHLAERVNDELARAARVVNEAIDAAHDVVRLTAFDLRGGGAYERSDEPDPEGRAVIEGGRKRVRAALARLEALPDELDTAIERHLGETFALLSPYAIARAAGSLRQYIRAQRGRHALSLVDRVRQGTQRVVRGQLVRALYRRSEGVLLARQLSGAPGATGADALLRLTASVSPRSAVVNALPFHYRQLFLGKPTITRDYWVGWQEEKRDIARIVDSWRRGYPGGLLVVGEENAGKTSLSRFAAAEHFPQAPVYTVHPPAGGSLGVQEFLRRVTSAAGSGEEDDPLQHVPHGSVLLFEDLDLWWERSPHGLDVLRTLLDLMDAHGTRCFFIANMDIHAFRFLQRVQPIDQAFLGIVTCAPFSAQDIRDVVLLRHTSAGLTFQLDGRSEDTLSDWQLARFFNSLFDESRGNIGVALHSWIANIRSVDGPRLVMEIPARPRTDALDALHPVQTALLVAFLLHRNVSFARLGRLSGLDADVLKREVAVLRRAGLIVERTDGTFAMDRFVRPHVTGAFLERQIVE
jgi:amino acid transporter